VLPNTESAASATSYWSFGGKRVLTRTKSAQDKDATAALSLCQKQNYIQI